MPSASRETVLSQQTSISPGFQPQYPKPPPKTSQRIEAIHSFVEGRTTITRRLLPEAFDNCCFSDLLPTCLPSVGSNDAFPHSAWNFVSPTGRYSSVIFSVSSTRMSRLPSIYTAAPRSTPVLRNTVPLFDIPRTTTPEALIFKGSEISKMPLSSSTAPRKPFSSTGCFET